MVVWLENSSLNRLGDYIRLGCVDGKVPFTSVVLRIHRIPVDIVIVILKLVRSTRCSLRDPTLVKARGVERLQELQGEGWFEWQLVVGSVCIAWVHEDDVAKTVFRMRNRHVEVYGYAFWVNLCTSGFHGVNEPRGVRVAREDNREVTKGREDVREVFQQRGSGAKRKLSRRGRNKLCNEPILALPEGADDFVVYYDAQSKDLEACLEKKGEEALSERDMLYRGVGRRSEAKNEFEIDIRRSDLGLLLQPELPEYKWERMTKDIVVKLPSLSSGYDAIGCIWKGMQVTVLWAITGESELNGSNLVQETTNKIVVGYGWLKVSPWRVCGPRGHELKHNMIVLAKVRGDSKRGPEFTWERKDQMRSKCPQLFVDSANASSS
ncbi:hypothetical protein Tco_1359632 [Tanacetum coccineum]